MSHVGCEGVVGMCVESFGVVRIIVCLAWVQHSLVHSMASETGGARVG